MKKPRLCGDTLERQSRWTVLVQEFDSTLCVLLQLMNTLSLDAALVSYLLQGTSLKGREEFDVVLLPTQGSDVLLPIAFAVLAESRPWGLGSPVNRTWILG
jgi:hypothetical protein